MQFKLSRDVVVVLLSCFLAGCSIEGAKPAERDNRRPRLDAPPDQTRVNVDAQILADFKSRIDKYMELHNKLAKEAPPLKETKDPAKIQASQDVLAEKIRVARAEAKQGDIFTPEARQLFRRLMYPETKGTAGQENKAAMKEEQGELKGVVVKVNARYPDNAPLMTVAPDILAALPKLPEDLEYRFVSKHMILLDTHANLIVDFIPNAIP
jgi:hypothetical protein